MAERVGFELSRALKDKSAMINQTVFPDQLAGQLDSNLGNQGS